MGVIELERTRGVSLWRQIEQILESEVLSGTFGPGQRLPTECELAARFDVNRHTVRRSLASLQEKGVLRIEQGRGIFVREPVVDYAVTTRTRFSENLQRQSRVPGGTLLGSSEITADTTVAEALNLVMGEAVVLVQTLGMADGQPILASNHYFSKARCAGIADAYRETGSITQALKACGIDEYWRKWTRITARLPNGADAQHLKIERNRPILVTESVNVDMDGRPVEYGVTRFSGDWVQLTVEPERLSDTRGTR